MKELKLAVDCGKGFIKVKAEDQIFKFENRVLKSENGIKPNSDSFEVQHKGEKYLVGNGIGNYNNMTSNKVIEENKISIYTAIAKTMKELNVNAADVKLVTGLPNLQFNKDRKKEMENLLAEEDVFITLDNVEYNFRLPKESILVFPENYCYEHQEIPRVLNLDFGYRNLNMNLLTNGMMEKAYMMHTEQGIYQLKDKIARKLEGAIGSHFKIDDITDHIILNGLPTCKEDSKKIIFDAFVEYLEDIKAEINGKMSIDTIDKIVLRGGGTKLMDENLLAIAFNQHFKSNNIEVEGDEFKNVEVFELLGRMMD